MWSIAAFMMMTGTMHADVRPQQWTGQVGASYAGNSGNTNNSAAGLSSELGWQKTPFKVLLSGGFIQTRADDKITSKEADAMLHGERAFPHRVSAYLQSSYYRDLFAGIRNQYVADAGGLYRLMDGQDRSVSLSLSLAQTWEGHVMGPDRVFLGARPGLAVHWKCSDAVTADLKASAVRDFSDPANWRVQSAAALTSELGKIFAVTLSYQLRYAHKPDPGKRPNDSSILVSLVAHLPSRK